jgi:glucose/mannose-6-phosphate isomerase
MPGVIERLDDAAACAAADPRKLGELIRGFAGQVADAGRLAERLILPGGVPRAVCVLGMGGSAVAGDLLQTLCDGQAPFPVHVVRGYTVPAWVGAETLVVASSYSGQTEETLAAFEAARARGARALVLTTGGELGARARREGLPWVRVPPGLLPRAALGYLLVPLVAVLEGLGADLGGPTAREEAVRVLAEVGAELTPEVPAAENPAKVLAALLVGRVPVIYGTDATGSVAYRWRTQLEENAKVLALSGVLPEMNHNGIEAWSRGPETPWTAVLLRDAGEHPRVARRAALTREIVGTRACVREVWARGEGRLARLLSLVLHGDWTSYYLALLRGVDPWAIDALEAFKRRMAEAPGPAASPGASGSAP